MWRVGDEDGGEGAVLYVFECVVKQFLRHSGERNINNCTTVQVNAIFNSLDCVGSDSKFILRLRAVSQLIRIIYKNGYMK